MHFHIEPNTQTPAYMQLYQLLRRAIETGIYPAGTHLPSKRLLAEESGVSVITVEHTYSILCDEGYIEARPRSGYYVIYLRTDFPTNRNGASPHPKTPSAVQPVTLGAVSGICADGSSQHALQMEDEILQDPVIQDAASASASTDSPLPFPMLARTMRRILTEYGEKILIKSPNHGCSELRRAIADYLNRSFSIGKTIHPKQIIIGSGAEYLYSLIVQLFRAWIPGGAPIFALESPSYEKIRQVYEANGVVCDLLQLGKDGIQSDALAKTNAQILHITPFHSYPSGITADASKRREYLDWADKRGGYLIEDNYDSELTISTKNEDTVFSLAENGNVLYLNTFSHTVAPSIRVGYLLLPPLLLPVFEKHLGFYSCTVPVFEQYVLAELLNSGEFERHINRVRRARRAQRAEQK